MRSTVSCGDWFCWAGGRAWEEPCAKSRNAHTPTKLRASPRLRRLRFMTESPPGRGARGTLYVQRARFGVGMMWMGVGRAWEVKVKLEGCYPHPPAFLQRYHSMGVTLYKFTSI